MDRPPFMRIFVRIEEFNPNGVRLEEKSWHSVTWNDGHYHGAHYFLSWFPTFLKELAQGKYR